MNYSRKGRKGRGPYFVPHARDFEGRPQRAGRPGRARRDDLGHCLMA